MLSRTFSKESTIVNTVITAKIPMVTPSKDKSSQFITNDGMPRKTKTF